MTKQDKHMTMWFEAFSEVNALENELLKLPQLLKPFNVPNLLHLTKIATGNLRTVREFLVTNQAPLMKYLRTVEKAGKGK